MRRSLKHLLLWLLIAVLPLQGFAAVMLHGWTMPAPAMASMPAMDHAAMAASGHDACMDASPAGEQHGCSASAACCIGAAVLPGLPDFTLPLDAPDVHQAWIITPVAGHIPDGLERPPRRFAI
jgi:hypothetical protein